MYFSSIRLAWKTRLNAESGWRRFPPRLPEQPIFYPVLTLAYARQIARNWHVQQGGAGFVTEFFYRPGVCQEVQGEDRWQRDPPGSVGAC